MQSSDDMGLVREYADTGSEAAFEALVNRHLAMVYSAALRQVRERHLAEDETESEQSISTTRSLPVHYSLTILHPAIALMSAMIQPLSGL